MLWEPSELAVGELQGGLQLPGPVGLSGRSGARHQRPLRHHGQRRHARAGSLRPRRAQDRLRVRATARRCARYRATRKARPNTAPTSTAPARATTSSATSRNEDDLLGGDQPDLLGCRTSSSGSSAPTTSTTTASSGRTAGSTSAFRRRSSTCSSGTNVRKNAAVFGQVELRAAGGLRAADRCALLRAHHRQRHRHQPVRPAAHAAAEGEVLEHLRQGDAELDGERSPLPLRLRRHGLPSGRPERAGGPRASRRRSRKKKSPTTRSAGRRAGPTAGCARSSTPTTTTTRTSRSSSVIPTLPVFGFELNNPNTTRSTASRRRSRRCSAPSRWTRAWAGCRASSASSTPWIRASRASAPAIRRPGPRARRASISKATSRPMRRISPSTSACSTCSARAATNEFTPRVNYGHVSEQWATLFENEARGDRVEARNILNAQFAWKHGKLVTTLYGSNLTDQHYMARAELGAALRGPAAAVRRARRDERSDRCTRERAAWPCRGAAGRSCLGGAGDPVLRLRAQLPGPAAAVDPGEADPGRARRHRRSARPDQRAVLRAVLLRAGDSGRLARRPHQPRARAVPRLRAVERGDRGLRHGRQLPAARGRAHVGGRGRGGRRAAVVRHHLRLLPARARAARRWASSTSARRSGMALGVAFGASIAAAYDWRSAFICARRGGHRHRADACWLFVREPVRGGLDAPRAGCVGAPRRRRRRSGRPAACSSRIRCCCACRWPAARRSSSPTRRSTSPRCS